MQAKHVLVMVLVLTGAALAAGPVSVLPQQIGSDASPGAALFTAAVPARPAEVDAINWTNKTAAPSPGRYWAPGFGAVRDTIYICGGRESGNLAVDKITGYDVVNDAWITSGLPTLTTGRRAGAGGRVGNKIISCGGRNASSQTLNSVEIFDADTKTVSAGANMPTASWACCGAATDDKIYIIGNESSSGTTYEYDVAGNTWTTKAVCPEGRGWAAAAAWDGKVYVTGGYGSTQLATCYEFDPVGNTWTQKANMPGPRNYHGMVAYDGALYVFGGAASQTADALVYKYDIASNTWSTETSMPTPQGWHMCTVVGDKVYVQYGSDCSTPTYLMSNMEGSFGPPPAADVGVSAIVAPPPSMMPGTIAPVAEISNFGSDPQSNIPVYCEIDSAGTNIYVDMQTYAGPLAPGAVDSVTFTGWTSGPAGNTYDVTMYTDLSGDVDPSNDTMMGTTTISTPGQEDTIYVDGPNANNGVGLTAGGTFYTAARLAPDQAADVIALIFFHYDASSDEMAFVYEANTATEPGPVVESIPYTGADTMWIRCNLSSPYPIGAGEDVWVGPRYTHTAGAYPGGVDAGPAVAQRGDWLNYQGSWEELRTLGLNYNWNIRAIVMYQGSVEEQVLEPTPFGAYGVKPTVVRDRAQISYTLNRASSVELGIYDVSGQLVRTLVSGIVEPGEWTATWDRTGQNGERVARGTYFYRLIVDGESVGGKAVVVE